MINSGTLLIIVVTRLAPEWIDRKNLVTIAALTSMFLIIKLADWLRLFESTAFYVQLIKQTLLDITPFMALFFFALLLFTIPISILNLNRYKDN